MTADLIYDVGMHNGADTAFYLAKGFRVVAVEANPELVQASTAAGCLTPTGPATARGWAGPARALWAVR